MDSNSSDEEEDSDVFYSCDSESLVSNSPIKASIIISEPDDEESPGTLPETESCDPISLNIMRKLSISSSSSNLISSTLSNNENNENASNNTLENNNTTNNNPATVSDRPNDSTKVRFAEGHITYNIEQLEEEFDFDYDDDDDSDDGEKENRRVGVELKKVFTKIITKAEEVQKNVVSRIETRIERKKDKEVQVDQSKVALSQSPTKWLKDLIVPTRNPSLQLPKNAVTSFARRKNKREFGSLVCVQTIDVHEGAIWTMKYSYDGTLMASGGQDGFLRVWKVNTNKLFTGQAEFAYFQKPPANVFHGHNGDILDVSWAKSNKKLLSASMDRTVRLWKLDQEESVRDTDIVTSVTFHPQDENIFLSGSLDNKLSLWNIEQKTSIKTIDTQEFITTVSFTLDGKLAIAGLHSGMCRFFSSENLAPSGKIYVHSSRGKNKKGKKISGIEALPDGKSILITSNDSRIRLYKLDDFSCECKYKGLVNNSFQIKATSSANGNYVICGSEDNVVYIWNIHNDNAFFSPTDSIPIIGSGTRKDVNASYECFPANSKQPVVVTVALFAPHPPPPSKSIDEQLQATSPSTSPPDNELSLTTSSTSNPIPAPTTTTKKTTTNSTSPPNKVLPHRNSISSIFSLIAPNSLNKSSAKSISSHSHSHSNSSSPGNSKPSTPDGATSSHATPITSSDIHPIPSSPPLPTNTILSTSPPPTNTISNNNNNNNNPTTNNPNKKASGGRAVDMVVDDQLMYIVTADASGQIKIFENLPLQYLSLPPLSSSSTSTSSSSTNALSPPTPIPTSAPIIPSPLAAQSLSSPPSSSSLSPSPTSSSNGTA